MVFLSELVRYGLGKLHRICGSLRGQRPQMRNQRTDAGVVDEYRDTVTRNWKVSVTELHEQGVKNTISSPAEDGDVVVILVIGVFTATVASFLFEEQQTQHPDMTEVLARLERIEKRLESIQQR